MEDGREGCERKIRVQTQGEGVTPTEVVSQEASFLVCRWGCGGAPRTSAPLRGPSPQSMALHRAVEGLLRWPCLLLALNSQFPRSPVIQTPSLP